MTYDRLGPLASIYGAHGTSPLNPRSPAVRTGTQGSERTISLRGALVGVLGLSEAEEGEPFIAFDTEEGLRTYSAADLRELAHFLDGMAGR